MEAHQHTLEQVCGISLTGNDFNDDRLSILLRRLSVVATWQGIEFDLSQRSLEVYDLACRIVRLDTTTVSSHHLVSETGLFQFGHSKDDPSLPQLKLMMGSLDPVGMPLVTQVVSGEQADDGLYLSAIAQVQQTITQPGLLFVGDSKMSALATRATIDSQGHYYLSPLPMTGNSPQLLVEWLSPALNQEQELFEVERADETGQMEGIAEGYEVQRRLQAEVADLQWQWQERVLVVYAPRYAQKQIEQLAQRLETATDKLQQLRLPPAQGRRVWHQRAPLEQKVLAILKQHRVEGLLQVEIQTYSSRDGCR